MAVIWRGPPNSSAECTAGVWQKHDLRPISGFILELMQNQITQKRYKIELYLRTNRKSCDLSNGAIFNDLERTLPRFQDHAIFDAECLRNATIYRHSFNEILIGTYTCPTQQCRFEWLWVNFSDLTKHSMTRSTRGLSATAEFLVCRRQ